MSDDQNFYEKFRDSEEVQEHNEEDRQNQAGEVDAESQDDNAADEAEEAARSGETDADQKEEQIRDEMLDDD